jgi:hypothetical protein
MPGAKSPEEGSGTPVKQLLAQSAGQETTDAETGR